MESKAPAEELARKTKAGEKLWRASGMSNEGQTGRQQRSHGSMPNWRTQTLAPKTGC